MPVRKKLRVESGQSFISSFVEKSASDERVRESFERTETFCRAESSDEVENNLAQAGSSQWCCRKWHGWGWIEWWQHCCCGKRLPWFNLVYLCEMIRSRLPDSKISVGHCCCLCSITCLSFFFASESEMSYWNNWVRTFVRLRFEVQDNLSYHSSNLGTALVQCSRLYNAVS